ncbi:uncharacterized protein LOC126734167 [Anthonomus grandis grandis]|uniref:uncharacterized protein LOC126734167 n=1 Tax=Anthonomus grandis grandis TaxID=2921223 RepID=UPI002165D173|nr:uncharacterized protein LOC126734167 [Anthonomus grandis grandis]
MKIGVNSGKVFWDLLANIDMPILLRNNVIKGVNICSLHFAESSFMSPSNQRLRPDAIPTLFLTRASTSTDNSNIIASHTSRKEFSDASMQTDTPMQVNVFVQTDICNNTDKFCQTSMKISAMTPRKIQLRKEIKTLEKEGSHAKRSLEVGVTLDDVQKFLDDNYPADSCAFLKSQLSLLNKSPRASRYTNEYNNLL